MKNLVIIGAGDFSRETAWVAERMNLQYPQWNILGFVDDGKEVGTIVDGYPVLGPVEWLCGQTGPLWAVCGIGTSRQRKQIWDKLEACPHIYPATLVDPAAIIGKNCVVGPGCVLCAGTILTVGIRLGKHCIVNLSCALGHDVILEDYCTVHPRVDLSGKVHVGRCTDMGAGAIVRNGITIGKDCIVGMGSLVTKDIPSGVVAYGSPCKVIRENQDGIVFR